MAEKNSIVLRKVKQCLMDDGWTKGTLGGEHTPHCVLGAFAIVEGWIPSTYVGEDDDGWYVSEETIYSRSEAAQAFSACLDWDYLAEPDEDKIINWNDSDDMELDLVLAELERCAQAEEAAGR